MRLHLLKTEKGENNDNYVSDAALASPVTEATLFGSLKSDSFPTSHPGRCVEPVARFLFIYDTKRSN